MNTTERLYYEDSHLTEFDARVVAVTADAEGRAAVVLDRTAFYPTGGGQPADTGVLGGARVVDCVEAEGGEVLHVFEGEAPRAGACVRGSVDWPRRLDHVQQHTGQHILSQAFVELYGAQTRSFRMMADACEIDVDLGDPSDEKIERAVDRANEVVWDDRAVRVHNVTTEEADEGAGGTSVVAGEKTSVVAGDETSVVAGDETSVVAGGVTGVVEGGGARIVARVFEGRDAESLRRLASAIAAHANTIALLGSREEGGARLVFARSVEAGADMNALMREASQALGGRGGGRPDMAHGGGPLADKLSAAIEEAARKVKRQK